MRLVNHEHFINTDLDMRPNKKNPGGGVHSKVWNIMRAFPNIEVSSELGDTINIIDPMWFDMKNTLASLDKKFNAIQESKALNILWQEEMGMFRLSLSRYRFILFNMFDAIFNCNQYLNTIMKVGIQAPMRILYTPIDSDFYRPAPEKRMQIVAMSKVCVHKNLEGVIQMFEALPNSIDKIFIGSRDLWGNMVNKSPSLTEERLYETRLKNVCEWYPSLNKQEVATILSESWGYLNMSNYDVGCLSFLESAMSGCHCFCWDSHPMFDEYSFVDRFKGVADGAAKIVAKSKAHPGHNQSLRNFMEALHSYEAVNLKLREYMKEVLLG